MTTDLNYEALTAALSADDQTTSAAEMHGTLTGLLCARARPGDWQRIVFSEPPLTGSTLPALVDRLLTRTQAELRGDDFSFEPLLPSVDVPIEDQVEALTHWCSGFVLGLGSADGAQALDLSPEGQEIVADLMQIADAVADTPDEETARALAELTEFVRVGVQTVYDEHHPRG